MLGNIPQKNPLKFGSCLKKVEASFFYSQVISNFLFFFIILKMDTLMILC